MSEYFWVGAITGLLVNAVVFWLYHRHEMARRMANDIRTAVMVETSEIGKPVCEPLQVEVPITRIELRDGQLEVISRTDRIDGRVVGARVWSGAQLLQERSLVQSISMKRGDVLETTHTLTLEQAL